MFLLAEWSFSQISSLASSMWEENPCWHNSNRYYYNQWNSPSSWWWQLVPGAANNSICSVYILSGSLRSNASRYNCAAVRSLYIKLHILWLKLTPGIGVGVVLRMISLWLELGTTHREGALISGVDWEAGKEWLKEQDRKTGQLISVLWFSPSCCREVILFDMNSQNVWHTHMQLSPNLSPEPLENELKVWIHFFLQHHSLLPLAQTFPHGHVGGSQVYGKSSGFALNWLHNSQAGEGKLFQGSQYPVLARSLLDTS